ncbi:MAG: hypothetical protein HQM10_21960 [Candidatus Riflebacteria bacterium]|nr:hypothetical protein [Candidatus Riflebacteria bacterium]
MKKTDSRAGNAKIAIVVVISLISLFVAFEAWRWFFCRIEIEGGKVGVLIHKIGENLPSGEIIATKPHQKGILLDVLAEGRYYYTPFFWDYQIFDMVEVPVNNVGVIVRLYGNDLPDSALKAGQVIASEGQKGILADILPPGKYRVNPFAEKIEIHKCVSVPAGYAGIVTNVTGEEPKEKNTLLVSENERGVCRKILTPGTYFLNPYIKRVTLMDCRSHRYELVGNDALKFPSSDAFEMTVLMTIEWAIDEFRAPEIFVRIGELDINPEKNEILQKVIVPVVRGYGRIEGSKYSAIQYIGGDSRQKFQDALVEKIKATCKTKGILIKSVLINDIEPPQEIAKPIREREIAKEELNRNSNQLLQAQAEQNLARSEELVKQEQEKVKAKTDNLVKIIEAKNAQKVSLIDQDKKLNMEKTFLEASRKEAEAILLRGKAEADVIKLNNIAETEALRVSVQAFGNPEIFAYHEFINKMAPAMTSVLANTEGMFGKIFQEFLGEKAVKERTNSTNSTGAATEAVQGGLR